MRDQVSVVVQGRSSQVPPPSFDSRTVPNPFDGAGIVTVTIGFAVAVDDPLRATPPVPAESRLPAAVVPGDVEPAETAGASRPATSSAAIVSAVAASVRALALCHVVEPLVNAADSERGNDTRPASGRWTG